MIYIWYIYHRPRPGFQYPVKLYKSLTDILKSTVFHYPDHRTISKKSLSNGNTDDFRRHKDPDRHLFARLAKFFHCFNQFGAYIHA